MIQCTEDEVLPGQDQQIRICSNDWHVQTFVCVRGGAERSDIHHGWLKSVTAGRAVFDNKRRAFSAQQQKKVSDSLHLLAQTFSETFRAIAADPDGTIVVDLQIPDLVFLYQTEDFFFQICKYFRLSEIPEAAAVTCDNNGICARQMPAIVILFIDTGAARGNFKFKPYAKLHSQLAQCARYRKQSMREFIRIQRPVAVSALTQMWVGAFRPACVDHDILDRRISCQVRGSHPHWDFPRTYTTHCR